MVEGEKLPAVERLISQARIDQYAEASGTITRFTSTATTRQPRSSAARSLTA